MNLFLIGMPGVGKSYWAKKLRSKFQLTMIDLDYEIEKKFKTPIPQIFLSGEDDFREKEHEVLKEIIDRTGNDARDYIISTGGGTPCFGENLKLMKNYGKVIFLKKDISQIKELILKDPKERPLLTHCKFDLNQSLAALYLKRKPIYEQADFIIEPSQHSLYSVIEKLIQTKTKTVCLNQP